MTRCPNCQSACAEGDAFCRHCGAALQAPQPAPHFMATDWWQARALFTALLLSLSVLALRTACQPLITPWMGGRSEGRIAAFHLVMGLALGLGLAVVRMERERLYQFALLGLLGGLAGWVADYYFTYDYLLYTAAFRALDFLESDSAMRRTFGLLQLCRFAGPVLALAAGALWKQKRPLIHLKTWLFAALALWLRFGVITAHLSGPANPWYWPDALAYAGSVFLLFYGLARVERL